MKPRVRLTEELHEKYAEVLRSAGYIVLPPSTAKTYRFGPFFIKTDPVNLTIGRTK